MSGGKGGGSTTSVEVPEYIEQAAQRNLSRADLLSKMGYVPEYGPTVAAFTPMQEAAFQNTADTAGAFGMAAPTTQRDIMGGMDAPTEYAGGLRGYSSAPIYQGMVDEFAADRPAQKSYMDSFFIDPYSGEYGSNVQPFMDYTQSGTMADAANAQRANDLAIAQAQAGAGPQYVSNMNLTQNELDNYATTISPDLSYNPTTDVLNQDQRSYVDSSTDAQIAQYDVNSNILGDANNNFIDEIKAALGIDPTFDDPSSAGSYGGSLVTGEPTTSTTSISTYDPGETIINPITNNVSTGGYDFDPTDFNADYGTTVGPEVAGVVSSPLPPTRSSDDTSSSSDLVSDLVSSLTTSVDLPGNVFTRALNIGAGKKDDSDDGYAGSADDGTVLCTAYCNMGYLPREIYKLDRRYGVSLYRNDPSLILGYRKWATPIAEFIKTDTLAAKATRAVMWPIVKAWAEQMAHEMKPDKYSRNIAGKAIMLAGVPFSRLVGAIFVDKSVSKEAF